MGAAKPIYEPHKPIQAPSVECHPGEEFEGATASKSSLAAGKEFGGATVSRLALGASRSVLNAGGGARGGARRQGPRSLPGRSSGVPPRPDPCSVPPDPHSPPVEELGEGARCRGPRSLLGKSSGVPPHPDLRSSLVEELGEGACRRGTSSPLVEEFGGGAHR